MPATALTVIHKHLHREMFDFSMRLFRAGTHQVPAIKAAFEELAALLRRHAVQKEIGAELDRLNTVVRGLNASSRDCTDALLQLHLDWNRFLGLYLVRLDEEERGSFASRAAQLPLADLAQSALAQGEEGKRFLDRLWSVTTPTERIAIEDAQADVLACAENETAPC
jgi:hypothetical protein